MMTRTQVVEAIENSIDPAELRLLAMRLAEIDGVIRRTGSIDSEFETVPNPQPAPQPVEQHSDAPQKFYKVVYPHGNDRIEIWASSPAELEAKVRAVYSVYK
jgi:hypothetical protein